MSKQKDNLIKRLNMVSQNNSAYIEAYGPCDYTAKHMELMKLEKVKDLKAEVEKLEKAMEDIAEREELERLRAENRRLKLENKLEELGLSKEDLQELLRG
jgi:ABC-type phosphate transport system auxiliary subunit